MSIRTLAGILSGLCLALWPALGAVAAEAGSDELPWKSWEFLLGGYLTTHDSTLRVDDPSTGTGTEIDLGIHTGIDWAYGLVQITRWRRIDTLAQYLMEQRIQ